MAAGAAHSTVQEAAQQLVAAVLAAVHTPSSAAGAVQAAQQRTVVLMPMLPAVDELVLQPEGALVQQPVSELMDAKLLAALL